jgi:hypothetical protein
MRVKRTNDGKKRPDEIEIPAMREARLETAIETTLNMTTDLTTSAYRKSFRFESSIDQNLSASSLLWSTSSLCPICDPVLGHLDHCWPQSLPAPPFD